ncbi:MAG: VOC family protein [Thermoplasmata archaeon]|nr:VOC family protein [Thermoplasmata archaeon]
MATGPHLATLIPIRKMSRAIEFYTKKLDAKVVVRGTGGMEEYWASMTLAGADVWFVSAGKQPARKLAYQTLVVPDIKKYVATLQKRGVKFQKADPPSKESKVVGPIAFDTFGASAFFKDTEGNLLMVWQTSPRM